MRLFFFIEDCSEKVCSQWWRMTFGCCEFFVTVTWHLAKDCWVEIVRNFYCNDIGKMNGIASNWWDLSIISFTDIVLISAFVQIQAGPVFSSIPPAWLCRLERNYYFRWGDDTGVYIQNECQVKTNFDLFTCTYFRVYQLYSTWDPRQPAITAGQCSTYVVAAAGSLEDCSLCWSRGF